MKRGGLIFALMFLFLIAIPYASAIVLHQAADFRIDVDSNSISLQEATDSGYLGGTASSYASSSLISMGEHSAGQIWVNVDGAESSILSALFSANGLCASETYSTYESSNIPNPGHIATEIGLSSGKTLQQSINEGDFCECTPGTQKSCSFLSTVCTKYVDNVTCTDEGFWPSCTIETQIARGTSCSSDVWHSCNGTGGCDGWSNSGCGSCPFGYRAFSSCGGNDNYHCNLPTAFHGRYDMNSGGGTTWNVWSTSNDVWCHRCNFCFFGACLDDENVAWQIKP